MTIGVMNNPTKNVYEEIKWIGENGFDFVDLTYEPPAKANMEASKVQTLLEKYRLDVVGHTNPSLPAIYPISVVKEACITELKEAVDFFAKLNVRKVNIHPFLYGPHLSKDYKIEANVAILKEMVAYCRNWGMDLMLENYYTPFDTPEVFKRIVKEVPGLKIHLDIGHTNILGNATAIVGEFYTQCGKEIIHLHAHDNNGELDEHLPIGCGKTDWREIIKIIKIAGYDDTITLEIFCSDRDYLVMSKEKLREMWDSI